MSSERGVYCKFTVGQLCLYVTESQTMTKCHHMVGGGRRGMGSDKNLDSKGSAAMSILTIAVSMLALYPVKHRL